MALSTLLRPFFRYAHWLHTQWPAGTVEKLLEVGLDGETNLKRVRVAGDLVGAPLMHIFARFSRFRIFAEKKKCISCSVCTSVCHQGIDTMNFANKGLPMDDPECVRCSACVESCPTGVLTFGHLDGNENPVADFIRVSNVQIAEQRQY